MRLSGATSVLDLHNSFEFISKGGNILNIRKLNMLVLLGAMLAAPLAQAQITHVDMRVEGMT
jgi:hypothetical protein